MYYYIYFDSLVLPHDAFNHPIIAAIRAQAGRAITIISSPSVIQLQNQFLAVPFSFSDSLDGLRELYQGYERQAKSRIDSRHPGVRTMSVLNELGSDLFSETHSEVARKSISELANEKFYGAELGAACFTDLSLSLKKQDVIEGGVIAESFFRLTFFNTLLYLKLLKSLPVSASDYFIQNNIYSADIAGIDFLADYFGVVNFRLILPDALNLKFFKIVNDPVSDTILRRSISTFPHLHEDPSKIIDFTKDWLHRKVLTPNAFRYSPSHEDSQSNDDLKRLREFIAGHGKLCVYFSNSPDEIVSARNTYDVYCRSSSISLPRRVASISNEYEAISGLASKVLPLGYRLLVRLHPRLGSESRNGNISDSLGSLIQQLANMAKITEGIYIISPGESISSYSLGLSVDKIFTYRGTLPIEFALMAKSALTLVHDDGLLNITYPSLIKNSLEYSANIPTYLDWKSQIEDEGLFQVLREFYYQSHLGFHNADELHEGEAARHFLRAIHSGSSLNVASYEFYENREIRECSLHYRHWLDNEFLPNVGIFSS